jgi:GH24 family phage-related lysozyme (muramidase)
MNWYKEQKEAINWKNLGKGIGMGALMGTIPVALYNAPNTPLKQKAPIQNVAPSTPDAVSPMVTSTPSVPTTPPDMTAIEQTDSPGGDYMASIKPMLIKHEGKRSKMYLDSKGIPTIGVGFNLKRPDAKSLLKSVGAEYSSVMNGQELTEQQIDALLNITIKEAQQIAESNFSTFNEQPNDVKAVLVDMAFNLGPTRLAGFVKLKAAIDGKDYARAAQEMQNSQWYSQVGNRSKELVSIIKQHSRHD